MPCMHPSWVRLYPYQLLGKAGSSASLELRVRNYRSNPMHLEATLVLPGGVEGFAGTVGFDDSSRPGWVGRFLSNRPRGLGQGETTRRPGGGCEGGREIPAPDRRGRRQHPVCRVATSGALLCMTVDDSPEGVVAHPRGLAQGGPRAGIIAVCRP